VDLTRRDVVSPDYVLHPERYIHRAVRRGEQAKPLLICKFMHDTRERAPGCRCNWIECENPACPASAAHAGERAMRFKSRFCKPDKCRFFEEMPEIIMHVPDS
jgi:hypothetical protein